MSKVRARPSASVLPMRVCLARDASRSELVDLVFLIGLVLSPSGAAMVPLLGSLLARKFRNSRAIFSSVVPFFLGEGGAWVG